MELPVGNLFGFVRGVANLQAPILHGMAKVWASLFFVQDGEGEQVYLLSMTSDKGRVKPAGLPTTELCGRDRCECLFLVGRNVKRSQLHCQLIAPCKGRGHLAAYLRQLKRGRYSVPGILAENRVAIGSETVTFLSSYGRQFKYLPFDGLAPASLPLLRALYRLGFSEEFETVVEDSWRRLELKGLVQPFKKS